MKSSEGGTGIPKKISNILNLFYAQKNVWWNFLIYFWDQHNYFHHISSSSFLMEDPFKNPSCLDIFSKHSIIGRDIAKQVTMIKYLIILSSDLSKLHSWMKKFIAKSNDPSTTCMVLDNKYTGSIMKSYH